LIFQFRIYRHRSCSEKELRTSFVVLLPQNHIIGRNQTFSTTKPACISNGHNDFFLDFARPDYPWTGSIASIFLVWSALMQFYKNIAFLGRF
jgi:hypothetical protein